MGDHHNVNAGVDATRTAVLNSPARAYSRLVPIYCPDDNACNFESVSLCSDPDCIMLRIAAFWLEFDGVCIFTVKRLSVISSPILATTTSPFLGFPPSRTATTSPDLNPTRSMLSPFTFRK